MSLYLGLDSSTQSLTATVIAVDGRRREILFEDTLVFDVEFPHYGTLHGVLPSEEPSVAVAPPLMWVEALDAMLARVARSGIDVPRLRAISGAAQQHGSVYLADSAADSFGGALRAALARPVSPVWLDSSTSRECAAIEQALGGGAALARLTGSCAYERFTAAQIRRFAEAQADRYARTDRIHLVSSFLASVLIGRHAPLEPADASGMNLMDLRSRRWSAEALRTTAPDLERRLPPIVSSDTVVGVLSPYWQDRHAFPAARVIAWTGDNPSSQIGLGLIRLEQLAMSLGTSDTVFRPLAEPSADPGGTGHVFGSPTGSYLALTCFANGSLARERVRDQYAIDWSRFSAMLRETTPGNEGALFLPWFVPEITPRTNRGVQRQSLDPEDAARNVRGVVEGQMLAMRLHSTWMGTPPRVIRATGGAAVNQEILQVMADVFDAGVERIQPRNAASLGAALRAWHGDLVADGEEASWDEIVADFTRPASLVRPRPQWRATYDAMLEEYEAFERASIQPK